MINMINKAIIYGLMLCASMAYCGNWSYSIGYSEGYYSDVFGLRGTNMPEAWDYGYRRRSAYDDFWAYNPYFVVVEFRGGKKVTFFEDWLKMGITPKSSDITESSQRLNKILYRDDKLSQFFLNTFDPEKMETSEMSNVNHQSFATIKKDKSSFYGFVRYDFVFDTRPCILVMPEKIAPGRPWLWRARFFGHEPQTDIAMLGRGFVLAYIDVADMYGSPRAVAHWDKFYDLMTGELGFATKPAIECFSRGGLIAYNWAAKNPAKVACIYADAPVCDIKSWPLGLGSGSGSPEDAAKCLAEYGLTEETVLTFKGNPIDNLEPLAAADVPLLHICGAVDKTVPMAENTDILAQKYRALGGRIRVLSKPGVDHHPHSLQDPSFIVDFLLANTVGANDHINRRGDLGNCAAVFEADKKGTVAFLGGSITEMDGYRPKVCATLQKMFPQTQFDFINAGIASTCSTTGAFRLSRDVLSKGNIDLLFVEFAVNDNQDAAHNPQECIRGMEGIVRQTLLENPLADIVFLYSANESHIESYRKGQVPLEIAAHEAVAKTYGLCSINFASDVARRMSVGEFDWEKFGGVHPADFGAQIYAQSVRALLEGCRKGGGGELSVATHSIPAAMDKYSYFGGSLVGTDKAVTDANWISGIPDWKAIPGATREQFSNIDMLCSTAAGASLELDFHGTAIGLFVVAGPDAGVVEYSIDGGQFKTADLYHRYSKGLHYPRTVMLENRLSIGGHKLILRVSDKKSPQSDGTAVRIIAFAVNAGFDTIE